MAAFPFALVAGLLLLAGRGEPRIATRPHTVACGVVPDLSGIEEGSGEVTTDDVKSIVTWPWQATIIVPQSNGFDSMCGGALISNRFVISSASCVFPVPDSLRRIEVRLGTQNIFEKAKDEQRRNAAALYTFNPASHGHDIALIRLHRDVVFTNWLRPICLPDKDLWTEGGVVHSSWNFESNSTGGKPSIVWGHVDAHITDYKACRSAYRALNVTDSMICASGFQHSGHLTCEGNVGSPLFHEVNGVSYLLGITSWSEGCAQRNRPHVYTRVSKYREWIDRKAFLRPKYHRKNNAWSHTRARQMHLRKRP